jgi:hypothetical protein
MLEVVKRGARELAGREQVEPGEERGAGIFAFEIVGRVEEPCPPVCRWPRVSAPRLSRRRAIVLVKRSSPLQSVVTGRNSGVVA